MADHTQTFRSRLDTIEDGVVEAVYRRVKHQEQPSDNKSYDLLHQQIVALTGLPCDDPYDNYRLMGLLLTTARLRHDNKAGIAYSGIAMKQLYGKEDATNYGEAYLFLGLFFATSNLEFRKACTDFVRLHPGAPKRLTQLSTLSKSVRVWRNNRRFKLGRQHQELIDESSDALVIIAHPSDTLVNRQADEHQAYCVATIEPAIDELQAWKQLKAVRRDEYRPLPSCPTERLRCLGGIALAQLDVQRIRETFHLLKTRLSEADSTEERLTLLDALYHVSGCDSSLLMLTLKEESDRLFDLHFAGSPMPTGLFPDELVNGQTLNRLLSCRCLPIPGERRYPQTTLYRRFTKVLNTWADRLVTQGGGIWKDIPLSANFLLHRSILQTGCRSVAHGDKRQAIVYGNYLNGSIFDAYLQLINAPQPDVTTLISFYVLLREWKHDIPANEDRYAEFFRVVNKTQASLPPHTIQWLQLEEIKTDYDCNKSEQTGYKLVCRE